MSPEIQQALIGLGGSIVGALIGSGLISYHLGIRKERVEADRKTYINIKKLFTNNDLTYLKDANFYNGVPQRIVDNIFHIEQLNDNPNLYIFYNKKLNSAARQLHKVAEELAGDIVSRTTPEGDIDNLICTTRTADSRKSEVARKANQNESDELIEISRKFYDAALKLDSIALKELRLSVADLPGSS
ncbi:hypothetical protein R3F64_13210 [Halomonas sp. 5021]|uniref:hypothetical protein n=1 Tax=Halomonas sp. 5021 TaxID=3082156 RepID=UPI002FCB7B1B